MDRMMAVRGFGPGNTEDSLFGGAPGFVDCNDISVPCSMGGTIGGVTGSGVIFPPGGLVLNATPLAVPNAEGSFGKLKAWFD